MNKSIQDLFNDAVRQVEADQYDEAIKSLEPIIQLYPLMVSALVQRGRCHWEMHRWDKSMKDFDLSLRLDPESADAKWTVGLMTLQLGDFKRGWELYDARWESDAFKSPKLKTKLPRWEPDKGYKKVLVWCEQGIGDQIIYGSFLNALSEQVDKVTVMIDIRLIRLFQRTMPHIEFVRHDARIRNSEYDSQIAIGSLGQAFIKEREDIPLYRSVKYLEADKVYAEQIRQQLGLKPDDFVVGLSWGSTAPRVGEHKSVTLKELSPLFDLPNAKVVSLQYGKPKEEIEAFEKETGKKVLQSNVNTFFDLEGIAATMECCNVVVGCSNANAHISGAMNIPTYVLDANKLWYWNHKDGNTSLFYPLLKLFTRDHILAPWDQQIKELVAEVALYQELVREFES